MKSKFYFYPVNARMKNYPCEFSRCYKPLILNKITFCLSEELNYPAYNILQRQEFPQIFRNGLPANLTSCLQNFQTYLHKLLDNLSKDSFKLIRLNFIGESSFDSKHFKLE